MPQKCRGRGKNKRLHAVLVHGMQFFFCYGGEKIARMRCEAGLFAEPAGGRAAKGRNRAKG